MEGLVEERYLKLCIFNELLMKFVSFSRFQTQSVGDRLNQISEIGRALEHRPRTLWIKNFTSLMLS